MVDIRRRLDQCSGASCGSVCQLAAIGVLYALRFMLSRTHASIRGFDFVHGQRVETRVAVAIPNNASGNFDAATIREFKVADGSNITTADIEKRSASRALDSGLLLLSTKPSA